MIEYKQINNRYLEGGRSKPTILEHCNIFEGFIND